MEERITNTPNASNASWKWGHALQLFAVCLVGLLVLGTSGFPLKMGAQTAADLKQFSGTWECKYKGRTFFTLQMTVKEGVLGGTALHSARITYVDGEFVPVGDEKATDKILEARVSGRKLMLKIADGNDASDSIPLEFTLTGENQAEAKLIAQNQSEAPVHKKLWLFQRVSNH